MDELITDDDLVEMGADEELLNVLQDIGDDDDVNVKVYRTRKGSKGLTYLFECAPHEFSLAYVRDNYGGGEYRVQVRNGSKMLANKQIGIEALANLPTRAGLAEGGDGFQKLVELLQAQSENSKKDLQTMMEGQFKLLTLFMGMQGRQAQASTGLLAGLNIQDLAGVLVSLKELFGGGQAQSVSPDSMLKMFMDGLQFGQGLQPNTGADTPDVLVKMLEQLGPIFQHALSSPQGAGTGRESPQGLRQIRQHGLPAPKAETPKEDETGGDDMNLAALLAMKPKLRDLCNVAARAGDIDLYTDFVLDQVPMGYVGMLLEQPDPVGFLAEIEPQVNTYRPWFEALIANIAGVLNDEEEEGKEDEGLTGGEKGADTPDSPKKPESASDVVTPISQAKPKPGSSKPKPTGGNGKGNKNP